MPKTGNIRALIALNAVMLMLLAAVTFAPTVTAQQRARSKYVMTAGGVQGLTPSAVWILDTTNRELIAVNFDYSTKTLQGIGYRNVAVDSAEWMRGRPRAGG